MMLKRLLVLVAALAALFVFAPTASAQGTDAPGGDLPEECVNLGTPTGTPTQLAQCLAALENVPDECEFLLPASTVQEKVTTQQVEEPTGNLLACLLAIAALGPADGEEPEEPAEEPTQEAADEGYDIGAAGYDIGGYDGGIPEGGVASGFGPTGSDAAGAPLVARGAALLAVLGVLATGLLMMRRRRRS